MAWTTTTTEIKPSIEIQHIEFTPAPKKLIEEIVQNTIPLPPIILKCLPCVYCSGPVNEFDLPVVIEWGKKAEGAPEHLGRPYKTIAHKECNKLHFNKSKQN